MENLTHTLVGLAVAKAGAERASPYATTVCLIAANAPDADIIAALDGWCTHLHHHRGITHSVVGTLALALLIPILFWGGDRLLARLHQRAPRARLRGLALASLLACVTHPLLDWTNNYGVRPWLPFDDRWYYGDLVFIVDPYLWLILGSAGFLLASRTAWQKAFWIALALALTTLIWAVPARERFDLPLTTRLIWLAGLAAIAWGAKTRVAERWGSKLAIGALVVVALYWVTLSIFHGAATERARVRAHQIARGERVERMAVMPTLANPTQWRVVFETESAVYRFELSLGEETTGNESVLRYERPRGREAEAVARAADEDRCARIFLDFARFPVAQVSFDCPRRILVRLADLRYAEPSGGRNFTLDAELPCAAHR